MNVLIMDVGTSSMRGTLFDQMGNRLMQKQVPYTPRYVSDLHIEQDVEEFYEVLVDISRDMALAAHENKMSVDVLAITSQRSAVIPLDSEGRPLMPAIMWQDKRNQEICSSLLPYNDQILSLSGAAVNTVFAGGKMAWIKQSCPEVAKKTERFVTIPEYLMYRMTGNFVTDHTYGSRTNLMNLRTKEWDARLLELFGIQDRELGQLYEPGSVAGQIQKEFSRCTGLSEGIPVISAGGDQQCSAIGQGGVSGGVLTVTVGTGAFMMITCDEVPEYVSSDIICNCASVPGKYVIETNVLTCSSAFDWYRKNFCEDISLEELNHRLEGIYDQKTEVMVLPYFQGRSSGGWNAQAKAVFEGVSLSTSRDELLKALLEGIFLEIANNIELLRQYTPIYRVCVNGGMTNSKIMNQMQADIYGIPLVHINCDETTSLGALAVALVSQNIYETVEDAFKQLSCAYAQEEYIPNTEKVGWYQQKRKRLNELYRKLYQ